MTLKRIEMTPFSVITESGHSDTHKCHFVFLIKSIFVIII